MSVVPGKKVFIDSLSLKQLATIEGSITPGQRAFCNQNRWSRTVYCSR
jgi:hypothetical protein